MISIRTFIIPPRQSLSDLYVNAAAGEWHKPFVTPEQFVQLCAIEPDEFGLKIDGLNMAIVIHTDDEERVGFEQWGMDLWGSYLSALNRYIESGFSYGEALYGIDAKLIVFEKNEDRSLDIILKYDPLHVDKTITRFSCNEREFLQRLVEAADEFHSFMQHAHFSIPAYTANLIPQTIERLKQNEAPE